MTTAIAAIEPTQTITRSVTRRPNAAIEGKTKRGNGGLTRTVRRAIEAQVYDGLKRSEAAKSAGFSENAFYQALRKPAVLAYWNECLKVLRTGERARNIHRLGEIRDQDDNMNAAVSAVKVLEHIGETTQRSGVQVNIITPGVVVDLTEHKRAPLIDDQTVIELNPLDDNGSVGHEP